jgi:hypothetical protein
VAHLVEQRATERGRGNGTAEPNQLPLVIAEGHCSWLIRGAPRQPVGKDDTIAGQTSAEEAAVQVVIERLEPGTLRPNTEPCSIGASIHGNPDSVLQPD